MLSQFSYPIICTENFKQTVAFYEDHFDFVSAFELDGFVILQRQNWPDMYLAIIDSHNKAIPEAYQRPTSGMILNFPVDDAKSTYDRLYWEGLNLVTEPQNALCGRKHFFVEDPSGILIDVAENIDLASVMDQETMEKLFLVA